MEAVVLQDVVPLVEEVVLEVVEEAAVEEEDLKKALQLKLSVILNSLLIFIYNNENITLEVGQFIHSAENEMVCRLTNAMIPYFNAGIYLENKAKIGKVEEVFGPINKVYFTVKPDNGVNAASFKADDRFYIGSDKLLPLSRFTNESKGGGGGRGRGGPGGRGGGRGGPGGRGGGRGPPGGRGRGGPVFGRGGGGGGGRGGFGGRGRGGRS